ARKRGRTGAFDRDMTGASSVAADLNREEPIHASSHAQLAVVAPDFTPAEVDAVREFVQRLPREDNILWLPAHSIISQFDAGRHVIRPLVNARALGYLLRTQHGVSPWERAVAAWLLTRARILPDENQVAGAGLCSVMSAKPPRI